MTELGIRFEGEWASKQSVVDLINDLCETNLAQVQIWRHVYDSRKALREYDFLFPEDPEFQRRRSWCHLTEAWYAVAIICIRHGCLHRWIRYFNLCDPDDEINGAAQILFNGSVTVNGLQVEGKGVIRLSSDRSSRETAS